MFSWSWLDFGHFWLFGALMAYFWRLGSSFEANFGFNHISYSMIPSVLTFILDWILWSFLASWGPNWLFLGLVSGSNTILFYGLLVKQNNFYFLWFLQFWAIYGVWVGFWGICFLSLALFLLYHAITLSQTRESTVHKCSWVETK